METGDYFKYLKLEQECERLHKELNELERQFSCVKNVALRYFLMMKELKARQKWEKSLFDQKTM